MRAGTSNAKHRRKRRREGPLGRIAGAAARLARSRNGQATVEAALFVPLALGGVLLLVQPGIILYDRIVMQGAANEACRLLATSSDTADGGTCEQLVRRRLGAIPQQENFHVHEGGCTWEIDFSGNEAAQTVQVTIATAVKPLPLIDFVGSAIGFVGEDGTMRVEVSAQAPTQPSWASTALSRGPSSWPGAWTA